MNNAFLIIINAVLFTTMYLFASLLIMACHETDTVVTNCSEEHVPEECADYSH